MANAGVILERYKSLLRNLLPRGWAWASFEDATTVGKLFEALATEPARIEARGADFLTELHPLKTFEMIDNWERLLDLPDDCTPEGETLSQRRRRIYQKFTTGGGQSKPFFIFVLQQLGYDTSVFDVENYSPFRVGQAVVGNALTNGDDWRFAFKVEAPADTVHRFRVGESVVGDRLVLAQNEALECVVRRFAPAHTVPVFSYIE